VDGSILQVTPIIRQQKVKTPERMTLKWCADKADPVNLPVSGQTTPSLKKFFWQEQNNEKTIKACDRTRLKGTLRTWIRFWRTRIDSKTAWRNLPVDFIYFNGVNWILMICCSVCLNGKEKRDCTFHPQNVRAKCAIFFSFVGIEIFWSHVSGSLLIYSTVHFEKRITVVVSNFQCDERLGSGRHF
jgi:hypothetical protein